MNAPVKTIGSVARAMIVANPGKKNAEILALVKAEFPEAKTSEACIAWYKSDMKKSGKLAAAVTVRTSEVIEAEIAVLQVELEIVREQEAAEALSKLDEKKAAFEKLKAEIEAAEALAAELEENEEEEQAA